MKNPGMEKVRKFVSNKPKMAIPKAPKLIPAYTGIGSTHTCTTKK